MKQVYDFLKKAGTYYLATVEGNQPRVRPFGTVNEFEGKLYIIRPMIEIHESVTRRLSQVYGLPTVKPVCPYDQTNIRAELKPIVKSLCHMDSLTREHIYKAHHFDTGMLKKQGNGKIVEQKM